MEKTHEEQLVKVILSRIGDQPVTGRSRRLPGWATAVIFGAGLSLGACQPPAQEPCEEDCNNYNNTNNYNNLNNNHPLYGINNINNYNNSNNANNINNYNNLLYGFPDDGGTDLETDCPNCEYMAPMYAAPEDAGD